METPVKPSEVPSCGNCYKESRRCLTTPLQKKPSTRPKEFKFATDTRIQRRSRLKSDLDSRPFESTLRTHASSPKFDSSPTLPIPFKFTLRKKLFERGSQQHKWHSVAEETLNYHKGKFPPMKVEKRRSESPRIHPTVPVSPVLRTKERANVSRRSPSIVDETIKENSQTKLKSSRPKSSKKFSPTKVKPFSFDKKDKERYEMKEEKISLFKERIHEFKARNLPSNIQKLLSPGGPPSNGEEENTEIRNEDNKTCSESVETVIFDDEKENTRDFEQLIEVKDNCDLLVLEDVEDVDVARGDIEEVKEEREIICEENQEGETTE